MINYILQVILFQVLFLAIYDFFLSKETFFTKNRWYLLCTPVLSFLIPFIKIPSFQRAVPQEYIVYLPEIFLSPEKVINESSFYQSINYVNVLFWVGISFFSILFLIKLFKIINLIRENEVLKQPDFTLILIPNQSKAFSFFNYVFLGKEITETKRVNIIEHELVHSKQKHSIDLLMFEVLKIVMWFNPMIYFYQKRITLVHEYISDAIVAKQEDKETYINNLLSNFFQVENISFINQFYKPTFIKKRIIMMTKNKSKKRNQLKYLVIIPLLASMLLYTSCSPEVIKEPITREARIAELIDELTALRSEDDMNIEKVETEKVSFMSIDKAPTFPGCETGDRKCFATMVQKHFLKNFDSDLPKKLSLSAGKKRVFIGFKIDIEGNVVDVKVKAPHINIKEEVIRVMNSFPKMTPGENKGEKVAVNFNFPFVILVE